MAKWVAHAERPSAASHESSQRTASASFSRWRPQGPRQADRWRWIFLSSSMATGATLHGGDNTSWAALPAQRPSGVRLGRPTSDIRRGLHGRRWRGSDSLPSKRSATAANGRLGLRGAVGQVADARATPPPPGRLLRTDDHDSYRGPREPPDRPNSPTARPPGRPLKRPTDRPTHRPTGRPRPTDRPASRPPDPSGKSSGPAPVPPCWM